LNLECVFFNTKETPIFLKKICDVIKDSQYLEEVNISKNALGVNGAKALKIFLNKNKKLKRLIIDDAGLGGEGGAVIMEALLNTKRKGSFLETLSIKENILRRKCSKLLSTVLQRHQSTITTLILSRNNFFHSDLYRIIKMLIFCKKLQIIDFEDNFFSVDTSRLLSNSLINWPDLKYLKLNDCLIGKKGINYILEALSKGNNKKIEFLGLQYCSIDESGFYALASIIKKKLIMLDKLEIHGNYQVDKKCILKLISASKKKNIIDGLDELIDDDEIGVDKEIGDQDEKDYSNKKIEGDDEMRDDKEVGVHNKNKKETKEKKSKSTKKKSQ
jgi:Ran GTPase-activating protein 1